MALPSALYLWRFGNYFIRLARSASISLRRPDESAGSDQANFMIKHHGYRVENDLFWPVSGVEGKTRSYFCGARSYGALNSSAPTRNQTDAAGCAASCWPLDALSRKLPRKRSQDSTSLLTQETQDSVRAAWK
jgi:hypothetical protein